jgi:hypothetical protein
MSDTFKKLAALNVNDKTEKKGQFTYLSWAWAWDTFVQNYPDATYEIVKNSNNLPYFQSDAGGMVYTKVTAGGITHEMWLPIMDFKNQAKQNFDMMDVNKAVMRCLVKNFAMFGLGLYIYAGEDLPEEVVTLIDIKQIGILSGLINATNTDIQAFCNAYKIKTVSELNVNLFKKALEQLQSKLKKQGDANAVKDDTN